MMERKQNLTKEFNWKLIIRYKVIIEERTEDAPFIGALISAIDCKFNCKNCFNQHLKNIKTQQKDSDIIIQEIKQNPFNKGIILAGLEWSNQSEEAKILIETAIKNNLQVILYTGMDIKNFKIKYPELMIHGIYLKYGKYEENQKTINHIGYGVTLASFNQHIIKI